MPRLLFALALAFPFVTQPAPPKTGADVLERMRAAYDGKWYHTLTFTQKTTIRRPNGRDTVETWYESLRHTPATGVQLRIDRGNPALGNGLLYTADSTWVVRAGKVAATRGEGNEFLPLIEGVYVQPVERTVRELAGMKVDLSRVRAGTWGSRPVWVVGAAAASDTTSPQFWVDAERNVVVRIVLRGADGQPPIDVSLDGYVPIGGGWLATKVGIGTGGRMIQTEEYSDWKVGVPLDARLFDTSAWATAPHWVPKP